MPNNRSGTLWGRFGKIEIFHIFDWEGGAQRDLQRPPTPKFEGCPNDPERRQTAPKMFILRKECTNHAK